jgi:predicted RNase H-like nuclease
LGETWLAGVDGCRAGWIAAFARPQGGEVRLRVVPRFAEVTAAREAPAIIAVDIPIGLPEQARRGGRTADNVARSLLGARKSSVFSVPSRRAVFAEVGPFDGQQSSCRAIGRSTAGCAKRILSLHFGASMERARWHQRRRPKRVLRYVGGC